MGYKAIKEHYDIKHIVAVYNEGENGRCICIGSPYIHDIIVIRIKDAKVIKQYKNKSEWSPANEDLLRYNKAIVADQENGVLVELVNRKDVFERSLPVYTIGKFTVVKDYCEEYEWPNTTHSGDIMYNNTYFKTQKEAHSYLLRDTSLGITYLGFWDKIKEASGKIKRAFSRLFQVYWYWILARTIGRFICVDNK